MHGRSITQTLGDTHASHPNRWRILGVLVLALLVTSIDHTIINVAMPRLVGDLGASSAQLQWIVAAYTIVFAGLLLTAGSIGDRFGRRHALLAGLLTFLGGSVVAATAGSTAALIAGRCVMGVGGALIMPTTLSILVNVFGDPRERAKAIAGWTAASGAGIALGPIIGGALMRSFSWSSVFWINVPLLVAAFVGALHLVPDSRDSHATRLDPVGAVLSIAAISSLVYAIIQAPERGWTSTASVVNFAVGTAVAILFVGWEIRRDDPMLDVALFRNRSFSAGSIALALLFFAMAGTVFLQAQYLQFVLQYTPFAAGFALVPAAIGMLLGTGAGAHLAASHGGRIAVTVGTLIATAGVAVQAAFVDGGSYVPTGIGLLLFGLGAGVAMPPATEMIMATLPPARAGVGSAVNDTVREFGGALGVAVIGSVAATSYATSMHSELGRFPNLTAIDRSMLVNNVGAATDTSRHLGAQAAEIASVARTAFVDSMHSSLWIAAGLAFCAAAVTFTQLPRQAAHGAHAAHGAVAYGGHHAVADAGHHAGHHPSVAAVGATAPAEVSAS
jgi:EmrB/QacA subfamily drug resistance transporter